MAPRNRKAGSSDAKSEKKKPQPAKGTGRQTQESRKLPKIVRSLLLLTAIASFSFLAYEWYAQRATQASLTRSSTSPKESPSPSKSKAESDAENAKERERLMKYLREQFDQWKPSPSLPFHVPPREQSDKPIRSADPAKRDAVKAALMSSWAAYVGDAFGADEYHPVSHTGSNLSSEGGIGYTIVDVLDTLLLVKEQTEYRRARDWVKANLAGGLKSWERRGRYNVFETTIRTLGGLLSAHALCSAEPSNIDGIQSPFARLCDAGDSEMYLEAASHLSNQLRPAYDTPTGVPHREVDFYSGEAFADADENGAASLAEATTVQLELKYLSFRSEDPGLWKVAERPMQAVRTATKSGSQDGLLPILLSPDSGKFHLSPIRLGSRGDSYYEYLIKQYVQTNRSEAVYRDMWDRSISGVKKHLVKQSTASVPPYLYTAEIIPRMQRGQQRPAFQLLPKQDHLVCFLPGALMLGAHEYGAPTLGWPELDAASKKQGKPTVREEDWTVGYELLRGCMATYLDTSTGLSPEIAHWRTTIDKEHKEEDWYIKQAAPQSASQHQKPVPLIDARNILRPETVESLFVAFRLTGDPIYRQWGWQIFQAFEKHCRLKNGAYAGIKDVDPDDLAMVEHEDKMETFWLSETLKYLYLLFDDQSVLPLSEWVFNTEAHPLPVFAPTQKTGVS